MVHHRARRRRRRGGAGGAGGGGSPLIAARGCATIEGARRWRGRSYPPRASALCGRAFRGSRPPPSAAGAAAVSAVREGENPHEVSAVREGARAVNAVRVGAGAVSAVRVGARAISAVRVGARAAQRSMGPHTPLLLRRHQGSRAFSRGGGCTAEVSRTKHRDAPARCCWRGRKAKEEPPRSEERRRKKSHCRGVARCRRRAPAPRAARAPPPGATAWRQQAAATSKHDGKGWETPRLVWTSTSCAGAVRQALSSRVRVRAYIYSDISTREPSAGAASQARPIPPPPLQHHPNHAAPHPPSNPTRTVRAPPCPLQHHPNHAAPHPPSNTTRTVQPHALSNTTPTTQLSTSPPFAHHLDRAAPSPPRARRTDLERREVERRLHLVVRRVEVGAARRAEPPQHVDLAGRRRQWRWRWSAVADAVRTAGAIDVQRESSTRDHGQTLSCRATRDQCRTMSHDPPARYNILSHIIGRGRRSSREMRDPAVFALSPTPRFS